MEIFLYDRLFKIVMTPNERLVLTELEEGKLAISHLARRLNISLVYAEFLCKALEQKGFLEFLDSKTCATKRQNNSIQKQERILHCKKCSGVLFKILNLPQTLNLELAIELKCPHCGRLSQLCLYNESIQKLENM